MDKGKGNQQLYDRLVRGEIARQDFKAILMELKITYGNKVRNQTIGALLERLFNMDLCHECLNKAKDAVRSMGEKGI